MSMRGDSPPVSGDPMPRSAFYNQAQEIGNRKDSKSVRPLCRILLKPSSSHMLTCTLFQHDALAKRSWLA